MHRAEAIIAALENAPALIIPLVGEVPASILKRRPRPDKWSAHEHACHLAEVHPLFFSQRQRSGLGTHRPRSALCIPSSSL